MITIKAHFVVSLLALLSSVSACPALGVANVSLHAPHDPVTITENTETFTLNNGIINAVVSKRSGDLISMSYYGLETLTLDSGGHSAGYWSHDVTGGADLIPRISVDPDDNNGVLAEVSIKGISGGIKMGHGPGTPVDGDVPVDIDIRYALGRGESGLYTYTSFDHRPTYGGGVMAEARMAIELADFFDYIHVDDARSGKYPLLEEGIDKYVYVALQARERAYGWTSSIRELGWFLLNPSAEYLSGGPSKVEFLAHGNPTVLNYWKSSHYYGANVTLHEGERWTKVIGPFMLYINRGTTHEDMVADAKAKLRREEGRWPYPWVKTDGYAPPEERSTVTGQLVLHDPLSPSSSNQYSGTITIGLSQTPYAVKTAEGHLRPIEWQNDGKFNAFWSSTTDPAGTFSISNVEPGTYTLYAYADGILGEFSQANIHIGDEGGLIDLGKIQWAPLRFGQQLWEVGKADRSAEEFVYGERYFEPGVQLHYPKLFPEHVQYRIGESRPGKDWFFAQAPVLKSTTEAEIRAFSGVIGEGLATPYTIIFNQDSRGTGIATLRLAITSTSSPLIHVTLNGEQIGSIKMTLLDYALKRHQMYGRWFETWISFDGDLLIAGDNRLTLEVPAGPLNSSVIYDYIRLELDPAATSAPAGPHKYPHYATTLPPSTDLSLKIYEVRTALDDHRLGLDSMQVDEATFTEQRNDQGHITGIYTQTERTKPKRVIDARSLENGGILTHWSLSPDGTKIAYITAPSADKEAWRKIGIWDLQKNKPLADELLWIKQTSIAWSTDSRGFYYSKYKDPYDDPERQRFNTAQSVYYHRLGDDRLNDPRVYASDRGGMVHYAEVTNDGHWLVINSSIQGNGRSEVVLINLQQPHSAPFKAIRTMRDSWQLVGSREHLIYFVTSAGASERKRLVALDTSDYALPIQEVVAEADKALEAARLSGNTIRMLYAASDQRTIKTLSLLD